MPRNSLKRNFDVKCVDLILRHYWIQRFNIATTHFDVTVLSRWRRADVEETGIWAFGEGKPGETVLRCVPPPPLPPAVVDKGPSLPLGEHQLPPQFEGKGCVNSIRASVLAFLSASMKDETATSQPLGRASRFTLPTFEHCRIKMGSHNFQLLDSVLSEALNNLSKVPMPP